MNIGGIYKTKHYGDLEVVSYSGSTKVTVRFLSSGYETQAYKHNILKGAVKDPYYPKHEGRGFLGEGKYKAKCEGKNTKPYSVWRNILTRCYREEGLKNLTYKDCSVCTSWLNFQNFARWYEKECEGLSENKTYQVDKDLLCKGNKVYSPETCTLITQEINSLIAYEQASDSTLPVGVYLNNGVVDKYYAMCRVEGVNTYLGQYNSPDEASLAYTRQKESTIKIQAIKAYNKGELSKEARDALLEWKV